LQFRKTDLVVPHQQQGHAGDVRASRAAYTECGFIQWAERGRAMGDEELPGFQSRLWFDGVQRERG
jgi:hypothetical protein